MKSLWYYDSPIGKLGIAEENGAITHVLFEGQTLLADHVLKKTCLLETAAMQLNEYFAGKRRTFDLPMSFEGTEFQRAVWGALQTIPIGETRSYKNIAQQVGSPKAFRAVGMANHNNPIPIMVPCHRVVGTNGNLTGFGGGLPTKQFLLDLEKNAYA